MVMIPAETIKMIELEHADRLAAARAERQESNRALIRQCADCVPTTWLDPLLSGPNKVAEFKEGAVGVVKLLTAIRKRILELSADTTGICGEKSDG